MLELFSSLASYGFFGGGTFGNVLAQWESLGVFSYLLPFLLIFALVFVVLSNIALFKDNRGVNAVISLAVGLLSLQFQFVPIFFSEIFPRFGMGLAIVLVFVIMGGIFIPSDSKGFKWLFAIIGLAIAAVVVAKSLLSYGWYTGSGAWWYNVNWGNVIVAALIIGGVIAVIRSNSNSDAPDPGTVPVFNFGKKN